MEKVELHPQIFMIEDFLTESECDQYVSLSMEKGFEEAKVGVQGQQKMNKGVRNNDRLMIFDNHLAEDLFERAAGFLPDYHEGLSLLNFNEMFRVYKYSPGQRFKMHRDGSYIRNEKEKSFYTFLIYLNDDFEGGETEFENLFTITPKKGTALVFCHPLRHEGKTLLTGFKYVLRTDIMYSF
ncbi:oxidoreductase, 2OG-Fe(II) oxygenase [Chryseobacterium lactis]|uniref:Oxidoreductase, 2OG-Fe(II) oxygenase n=1 Tax=Chryseobacterium lactis TaxID=1241981 RepID=A0A3G6RST0_CHRLC|nr:2OG-Fe(II) oxygenase [Chryseobacterium lactis]AZA81350.1 oxidoreductase, 2OG-Fe(II) oxygenase [Chryseobacterium lactis]AZB06349.1 oxidoreductase, 2OG-Fe(II) oxygenase [Chryseobacterium lactis]PNW15202.1 oxidoreductase, 2OG-Fe(II) oxygenase [Chryseobacterium lactis]